MAMQTTSDNAEAEPMMDINTTPLIDVLLVLIIMLIITMQQAGFQRVGFISEPPTLTGYRAE